MCSARTFPARSRTPRPISTTSASPAPPPAAESGHETRAGAYIAAGLMLFLLTFVVNAIARAIVKSK